MGYSGIGTASLASIIAPSGDSTGRKDAATINAAVAALPATGGMIVMQSGAWYLVPGTVTISVSKPVYIAAYGVVINAVSGTAGDVIRWYDSSTYTSRTYRGGGITGWPVIDGTNAAAGSAGLHIGDILQLHLDVQVQNFTGAGDVGIHLDNNYYWTEQLSGRIYAQSCKTHVMFDNSANTSGFATGSFERMILDIYLETNGAGDGVTFANGAFTTDHRLGIYGNFGTSTTQYAALRLTGSNGGGSSRMTAGVLNAGCELDDTVHTAPYTVYFNASGNIIQNCIGILDFSLDQAFTAANNAGQFWYSGIVLGDANLSTVPPGAPASAQSVNANGGTIFPNLFGQIALTAAAAYTGLIISAGVYQGQTVTIINQSANALTFAVAGTSNVADGVLDIIAANTARTFAWDTGTSLWYRIG
jgi:hypothetical protein